MSVHDRFEALAHEWHANGRPSTLLVEGYALIALRCWTCSDGARVDGVSDTVRDFVRASEEALPGDWLDTCWSERESCGRCGETYRLENIMLCTDCAGTYCHKCGSGQPRAANGNYSCICSGELVG
jgi:hypothetical protein